MKVIFLDIDGVLNCSTSTSRFGCFIGIDDDKVKRLREIVDATDAKIVLSSTWRDGWSTNEDEIEADGKYINRKLGREHLSIIDKTGTDRDRRRRKEVENWLEGKDIENYVILDDTDYNWGYSECVNHWVQPRFFDGGLQAEHVAKAIAILNASEGCK